jgi:hypothetical protein
MNRIRLTYDPYRLFENNTTPPGLYARQKWLGESSSRRWQSDFKDMVARLRQGRSENGLWDGSPMKSIRRLLGLHLTQRHADSFVEKSLDALLAAVSGSGQTEAVSVMPAEAYNGLPFSPASHQAVILPAALFLATIFGRAFDPIILKWYQKITADKIARIPDGRSPASLNNMLRALVVHPEFRDHPATLNLVGWLAKKQTSNGDWGSDLPFFHVLNALAHLDLPLANRQTQQACVYLTRRQHADGGWGDTDRLWCTFLAVHALRNKGVC